MNDKETPKNIYIYTVNLDEEVIKTMTNDQTEQVTNRLSSNNRKEPQKAPFSKGLGAKMAETVLLQEVIILHSAGEVVEDIWRKRRSLWL